MKIKLSKPWMGPPPPRPPHQKHLRSSFHIFARTQNILKKCDVVGYKNVFGTRSWWIFDKKIILKN